MEASFQLLPRVHHALKMHVFLQDLEKGRNLSPKTVPGPSFWVFLFFFVPFSVEIQIQRGIRRLKEKA